MKSILITGGSGSGKTTLIDKIKANLKTSKYLQSILDLDKIGYRNQKGKWTINERAVDALLNMSCVIHAGVSENILTIASKYDIVIVLDNQIDAEWIKSVEYREADRQKNKSDGGKKIETSETSKKLEDLKKGSFKAFMKKDFKYPQKTQYINSDQAYDLVSKMLDEYEEFANQQISKITK